MTSLFDAFGDAPILAASSMPLDNPLARFLVDVREFRRRYEETAPVADPELFTQERLAQRPGMEWLNNCQCLLVYPKSLDPTAQEQQLDQFLLILRAEAKHLPSDFIPNAYPADYAEPLIALDTETTGLDLRLRYDWSGKLVTRTLLVGLCLATSSTRGYYLPIRHTQGDGIPNWHPIAIAGFLDKLLSTCTTILHNSFYDREVLSLNGVTGFRPYPYFFDTQVLDFFFDVNQKQHNLKGASVRHLGRKMVEIHELFGASKKGDAFITFDKLTASAGLVYGCSDAMNTYGLFEFYASQAVGGPKHAFSAQPIPLQIDHKMVDTIRNMTRPGFPINLRYFFYAAKDSLFRTALLEQAIYREAGRTFNIGSPKDLNNILFDEFKIPPLPNMERGKNGCYSTAEEVLDELFDKYPDFTILRYIVTYRKLIATVSKIYLKSLANSYVDPVLPWARVRLDFSQTNVPTGRLSSSSSDGKERVSVKESTKTRKLTFSYERGSWDAGLNSQGIPSVYNRTTKVPRIGRLPPAAGIDLDNLYPESVHQDFIQGLGEL